MNRFAKRRPLYSRQVPITQTDYLWRNPRHQKSGLNQAGRLLQKLVAGYTPDDNAHILAKAALHGDTLALNALHDYLDETQHEWKDLNWRGIAKAREDERQIYPHAFPGNLFKVDRILFNHPNSRKELDKRLQEKEFHDNRARANTPEKNRRGKPSRFMEDEENGFHRAIEQNRLQSHKAPAGGLVARGTFYTGGRMLPKEATQTAPRPENSGILRRIVDRLRPRRKKTKMARRREWDQQEDEIIRKYNNSEASRLLGVSIPTVIKRRAEINAANPGRQNMKVDWGPEEIALLGTKTDREIADLLGLSANYVVAKRKSLGISPFNPTTKRRSANITWTDEILSLLGKVPDEEIARRLGTTIMPIWKKRKELNIPASTPNKVVEWESQHIEKLGKVSDRDLAKEMDISPMTVTNKRKKIGIKPFGVFGNQPKRSIPEELPERTTYEESPRLRSARNCVIVTSTKFSERGRLMDTLANQQRTQTEYPKLTPEQVWDHPDAKSLIQSTREGDSKKDYLPRMVYADWLEDHGLGEHAQSIREDAQQNPEEWDWDTGHDWDRARNMADVGVLPKGYSNPKTWKMFHNPHNGQIDSEELRQFPGLHISWDNDYDPDGYANMQPIGGGWVIPPGGTDSSGQRSSEHKFEPYYGTDQTGSYLAQDHLGIFHEDNGYDSGQNGPRSPVQKALNDDIASASRKLWNRMNPFKENL